MAIPLLAGRSFTGEDTSRTDGSAIINQAFAKKYFTNRNPIGGRESAEMMSHTQWSTVVGVIGDVRDSGIGRERRRRRSIISAASFEGGYIAVRSTLPAKSLAANIRSTLRSIDPNLAVGDIQTMGDLESKPVHSGAFKHRFSQSSPALHCSSHWWVSMGSWRTLSVGARAKWAFAWRSARSERT